MLNRVKRRFVFGRNKAFKGGSSQHGNQTTPVEPTPVT
jgi:hypothetical protein